MSDRLADGAHFLSAMQSDRETKAQQASIDIALELKGAKLKARLVRIEEKIDQLQESVNQLLARKAK